MAVYRLVTANNGVRTTQLISAESDADALLTIEKMVDGAALELWEGSRLVMSREQEEDIVDIARRMVGFKKGTNSEPYK